MKKVLDDKQTQQILKSIQAHQQSIGKVKALAIHIFIENVTGSQKETLRRKFQEFDKNHDGFLDKEELNCAFKSLSEIAKAQDVMKKSVKIDKEMIEDLIQQIDIDNTGQINYEQWLTMCLDIDMHMSDEMLDVVFDHFDVNQDGFITMACIQETFRRQLKDISDDDILEFMIEYDKDGDGQIDKDEFKSMMQ